MKTLTVRGIDPDLTEKLRAEARKRSRLVQGKAAMFHAACEICFSKLLRSAMKFWYAFAHSIKSTESLV